MYTTAKSSSGPQLHRQASGNGGAPPSSGQGLLVGLTNPSSKSLGDVSEWPPHLIPVIALPIVAAGVSNVHYADSHNSQIPSLSPQALQRMSESPTFVLDIKQFIQFSVLLVYEAPTATITPNSAVVQGREKANWAHPNNNGGGTSTSSTLNGQSGGAQNATFSPNYHQQQSSQHPSDSNGALEDGVAGVGGSLPPVMADIPSPTVTVTEGSVGGGGGGGGGGRQPKELISSSRSVHEQAPLTTPFNNNNNTSNNNNMGIINRPSSGPSSATNATNDQPSSTVSPFRASNQQLLVTYRLASEPSAAITLVGAQILFDQKVAHEAANVNDRCRNTNDFEHVKTPQSVPPVAELRIPNHPARYILYLPPTQLLYPSPDGVGSVGYHRGEVSAFWSNMVTLRHYITVANRYVNARPAQPMLLKVRMDFVNSIGATAGAGGGSGGLSSTGGLTPEALASELRAVRASFGGGASTASPQHQQTTNANRAAPLSSDSASASPLLRNGQIATTHSSAESALLKKAERDVRRRFAAERRRLNQQNCEGLKAFTVSLSTHTRRGKRRPAARAASSPAGVFSSGLGLGLGAGVLIHSTIGLRNRRPSIATTSSTNATAKIGGLGIGSSPTKGGRSTSAPAHSFSGGGRHPHRGGARDGVGAGGRGIGSGSRMGHDASSSHGYPRQHDEDDDGYWPGGARDDEDEDDALSADAIQSTSDEEEAKVTTPSINSGVGGGGTSPQSPPSAVAAAAKRERRAAAKRAKREREKTFLSHAERTDANRGTTTVTSTYATGQKKTSLSIALAYTLGTASQVNINFELEHASLGRLITFRKFRPLLATPESFFPGGAAQRRSSTPTNHNLNNNNSINNISNSSGTFDASGAQRRMSRARKSSAGLGLSPPSPSSSINVSMGRRSTFLIDRPDGGGGEYRVSGPLSPTPTPQPPSGPFAPPRTSVPSSASPAIVPQSPPTLLSGIASANTEEQTEQQQQQMLLEEARYLYEDIAREEWWARLAPHNTITIAELMARHRSRQTAAIVELVSSINPPAALQMAESYRFGPRHRLPDTPPIKGRMSLWVEPLPAAFELFHFTAVGLVRRAGQIGISTYADPILRLQIKPHPVESMIPPQIKSNPSSRSPNGAPEGADLGEAAAPSAVSEGPEVSPRVSQLEGGARPTPRGPNSPRRVSMSPQGRRQPSGNSSTNNNRRRGSLANPNPLSPSAQVSGGGSSAVPVIPNSANMSLYLSEGYRNTHVAAFLPVPIAHAPSAVLDDREPFVDLTDVSLALIEHLKGTVPSTSSINGARGADGGRSARGWADVGVGSSTGSAQQYTRHIMCSSLLPPDVLPAIPLSVPSSLSGGREGQGEAELSLANPSKRASPSMGGGAEGGLTPRKPTANLPMTSPHGGRRGQSVSHNSRSGSNFGGTQPSSAVSIPSLLSILDTTSAERPRTRSMPRSCLLSHMLSSSDKVTPRSRSLPTAFAHRSLYRVSQVLASAHVPETLPAPILTCAAPMRKSTLSVNIIDGVRVCALQFASALAEANGGGSSSGGLLNGSGAIMNGAVTTAGVSLSAGSGPSPTSGASPSLPVSTVGMVAAAAAAAAQSPQLGGLKLSPLPSSFPDDGSLCPLLLASTDLKLSDVVPATQEACADRGRAQASFHAGAAPTSPPPSIGVLSAQLRRYAAFDGQLISEVDQHRQSNEVFPEVGPDCFADYMNQANQRRGAPPTGPLLTSYITEGRALSSILSTSNSQQGSSCLPAPHPSASPHWPGQAPLALATDGQPTAHNAMVSGSRSTVTGSVISDGTGGVESRRLASIAAANRANLAANGNVQNGGATILGTNSLHASTSPRRLAGRGNGNRARLGRGGRARGIGSGAGGIKGSNGADTAQSALLASNANAHARFSTAKPCQNTTVPSSYRVPPQLTATHLQHQRILRGIATPCSLHNFSLMEFLKSPQHGIEFHATTAIDFGARSFISRSIRRYLDLSCFPSVSNAKELEDIIDPLPYVDYHVSFCRATKRALWLHGDALEASQTSLNDSSSHTTTGNNPLSHPFPNGWSAMTGILAVLQQMLEPFVFRNARAHCNKQLGGDRESAFGLTSGHAAEGAKASSADTDNNTSPSDNASLFGPAQVVHRWRDGVRVGSDGAALPPMPAGDVFAFYNDTHLVQHCEDEGEEIAEDNIDTEPYPNNAGTNANTASGWTLQKSGQGLPTTLFGGKQLVSMSGANSLAGLNNAEDNSRGQVRRYVSRGGLRGPGDSVVRRLYVVRSEGTTRPVFVPLSVEQELNSFVPCADSDTIAGGSEATNARGALLWLAQQQQHQQKSKRISTGDGKARGGLRFSSPSALVHPSYQGRSATAAFQTLHGTVLRATIPSHSERLDQTKPPMSVARFTSLFRKAASEHYSGNAITDIGRAKANMLSVGRGWLRKGSVKAKAVEAVMEEKERALLQTEAEVLSAYCHRPTTESTFGGDCGGGSDDYIDAGIGGGDVGYASKQRNSLFALSTSAATSGGLMRSNTNRSEAARRRSFIIKSGDLLEDEEEGNEEGTNGKAAPAVEVVYDEDFEFPYRYRLAVPVAKERIIQEEESAFWASLNNNNTMGSAMDNSGRQSPRDSPRAISTTCEDVDNTNATKKPLRSKVVLPIHNAFNLPMGITSPLQQRLTETAEDIVAHAKSTLLPTTAHARQRKAAQYRRSLLENPPTPVLEVLYTIVERCHAKQKAREALFQKEVEAQARVDEENDEEAWSDDERVGVGEGNGAGAMSLASTIINQLGRGKADTLSAASNQAMDTPQIVALTPTSMPLHGGARNSMFSIHEGPPLPAGGGATGVAALSNSSNFAVSPNLTNLSHLGIAVDSPPTIADAYFDRVPRSELVMDPRTQRRAFQHEARPGRDPKNRAAKSHLRQNVKCPTIHHVANIVIAHPLSRSGGRDDEGLHEEEGVSNTNGYRQSNDLTAIVNYLSSIVHLPIHFIFIFVNCEAPEELRRLPNVLTADFFTLAAEIMSGALRSSHDHAGRAYETEVMRGTAVSASTPSSALESHEQRVAVAGQSGIETLVDVSGSNSTPVNDEKNSAGAEATPINSSLRPPSGTSAGASKQGHRVTFAAHDVSRVVAEQKSASGVAHLSPTFVGISDSQVNTEEGEGVKGGTEEDEETAAMMREARQASLEVLHRSVRDLQDTYDSLASITMNHCRMYRTDSQLPYDSQDACYDPNELIEGAEMLLNELTEAARQRELDAQMAAVAEAVTENARRARGDESPGGALILSTGDPFSSSGRRGSGATAEASAEAGGSDTHQLTEEGSQGGIESSDGRGSVSPRRSFGRRSTRAGGDSEADIDGDAGGVGPSPSPAGLFDESLLPFEERQNVPLYPPGESCLSQVETWRYPNGDLSINRVEYLKVREKLAVVASSKNSPPLAAVPPALRPDNTQGTGAEQQRRLRVLQSLNPPQLQLGQAHSNSSFSRAGKTNGALFQAPFSDDDEEDGHYSLNDKGRPPVSVSAMVAGDGVGMASFSQPQRAGVQKATLTVLDVFMDPSELERHTMHASRITQILNTVGSSNGGEDGSKNRRGAARRGGAGSHEGGVSPTRGARAKYIRDLASSTAAQNKGRGRSPPVASSSARGVVKAPRDLTPNAEAALQHHLKELMLLEEAVLRRKLHQLQERDDVWVALDTSATEEGFGHATPPRKEKETIPASSSGPRTVVTLKIDPKFQGLQLDEDDNDEENTTNPAHTNASRPLSKPLAYSPAGRPQARLGQAISGGDGDLNHVVGGGDMLSSPVHVDDVGALGGPTAGIARRTSTATKGAALHVIGGKHNRQERFTVYRLQVEGAPMRSPLFSTNVAYANATSHTTSNRFLQLAMAGTASSAKRSEATNKASNAALTPTRPNTAQNAMSSARPFAGSALLGMTATTPNAAKRGSASARVGSGRRGASPRGVGSSRSTSARGGKSPRKGHLGAVTKDELLYTDDGSVSLQGLPPEKAKQLRAMLRGENAVYGGPRVDPRQVRVQEDQWEQLYGTRTLVRQHQEQQQHATLVRRAVGGVAPTNESPLPPISTNQQRQ